MILTDEEMLQLDINDRTLRGKDGLEPFRLSNKAQLKKIVEWLADKNRLKDEPCEDVYGYEPLNRNDLVILKEDWQVLLEEIE